MVEATLDRTPVPQVFYDAFPDYPELIEGGMGVNVSSPELAREIAIAGEKLGKKVMGTVSGTGIAIIMARRLQRGDQGGHIRKALEDFPIPEMRDEFIKDWYRGIGIRDDEPFKEVPMPNVRPINKEDPTINELFNKKVQRSLICANYALVKMAKEGHSNPIAINYLEKIQTPRLYEMFGAMLAGVDYVLMGAGITTQVPGVLDALANLRVASYNLEVEGAEKTIFSMKFNPLDIIPERYVEKIRNQIKRPRFLAIISSNTLAKLLTNPRRVSGKVDGFIVEKPIAGGHNAPPRNKIEYGEDDEVDFEELAKTKLPFYIAGGYASPEMLKEAKKLGAKGIQVGSIFAMSRESGLKKNLREALTRLAYTGELKILTDFRASPSTYPFKVAALLRTLYEEMLYEGRKRVCDIGYLRHAYKHKSGVVAFRCPSEDVGIYLSKGGKQEDTVGRKCICNGLIAGADYAQLYDGVRELPIVTIGDDYSFIRRLIYREDQSYSAWDVVNYLLGDQVSMVQKTKFKGSNIIRMVREKIGSLAHAA